MSNLPVNYAPPPEKDEIPVQQKKIRCRQCGRRAYENLVICPHCGRELHPAAPRWLVWGVPAVIAALFLLVLTGVGGGNPLDGVVAGLESGWAAISAFGAKIEPRITVGGVPNAEPVPSLNQQPQSAAVAVMPTATAAQAESVAVVNVAVEGAQDAQPVVENAQPTSPPDAAGEPAVQIEAPTPTATFTPLPTNTPEPPTPSPTATNTPEEPTSVAVATVAISATAASAQAGSQTSLTVSNIRATSVALTKTVIAASPPTTTPTPLATNTLAPTQTSAATNTPTQPALPTATATFSPTPAPTVTATPAFITYSIRSGDTLLAIADRYDTTVRELMDINGMSEEDVRRLRVGQEIKLPAPPTSAGPADSAAPSPTPFTYVIKAGDLPATIAQQFGITVDALLAANNLSRQDVTRLRIGQVLNIPTGSAANGPAPVANTGSTSGNYRLDAPTLRSPESGTPMSCSARDSLVWNGVPFMAPADQYVLHLGFVSNVAQNGEQSVTWILELIREQSRTSWDLDSDYCSLAPQQFGRQWRWYVQVIDENGNPVSPPSDIWAFSWN